VPLNHNAVNFMIPRLRCYHSLRNPAFRTDYLYIRPVAAMRLVWQPTEVIGYAVIRVKERGGLVRQDRLGLLS